MEGRWTVDSVGASPISGTLIVRAQLLILVCCCLSGAGAFSRQSSPQAQPDDSAAIAQQLFTQERWLDVVELIKGIPQPSVDLEYYYGMALAHLERWSEAQKALRAGQAMQPHDKRFPIELGGIAFKQKNYSQATRYLRQALRLDPADAYANDFLATIYFLQGNLEAALKYWNRVDKPQIAEVRTPSGLHVDPVLLDHAFAFSSASVLHSADWLTTHARLRSLEIFPSYRLDLAALPDSKFDATFDAQEINGWGNSTLQALVNIFHGLPYQEIEPEYYNINDAAVNFSSVVRWDAQKRRFSAFVSGPLHRNLKWRYRAGVDLRNENWDIRNSFAGSSPSLASLNLRRSEIIAEITRLQNGRLSWSVGAHVSRRDFRNVSLGAVLSPALLQKSYQLTQTARLEYILWSVPERRLTVGSSLASELGRIWSSPGNSFEKLQASLQTRWLPQARGDDFDTRWDLRAGKTFGQLPFDELFMLGLERDNDLWLRAHVGTHDGRKGSAPLGRDFFLSNWSTDKILYRNGLITLKAGPFLDTGKMLGGALVTPAKWLWDTGVQAKVFVLGVGVTFIYGKDLRSGHNAFYTTIGR